MFTRDVSEHNQNTAGIRCVLQRAYNVPTTWTPPGPKGTFNPVGGSVTMLYAPTPGAGDPRVAGERRIANPGLSWAYYVQ